MYGNKKYQIMRARAGRQMRSMGFDYYQDNSELGKTFFGRLIHDVGATVLKAAVQPFASFSNTTKYSNIFHPVLQTGAGQAVNKVIDVMDMVGHTAGKAFTSAVTEGLVNVKSKPYTPPVVPGGAGAMPGNNGTGVAPDLNNSTPEAMLLNQLGRNAITRKITFDIDSLAKYIKQ